MHSYFFGYEIKLRYFILFLNNLKVMYNAVNKVDMDLCYEEYF